MTKDEPLYHSVPFSDLDFGSDSEPSSDSLADDIGDRDL
jgi:hypothetical protein